MHRIIGNARFSRSIGLTRVGFLLAGLLVGVNHSLADEPRIDPHSTDHLSAPALSAGAPAAGKRVAVRAPEYAETDVFHTLYLPEDWTSDGPRLPIVFEYTGNYFPQSGSTGEPEDAALGFGLSGGKYIWVSLPYVNEAGDDNAVTWWGDTQATVEYAKRNVPRIIQEFAADPGAVFLCGFSRGAIGVNYLGLHDDEIASLWTAFIAHDHFDGAREWKTPWGSPLTAYQSNARKRLARLGKRPYWVSQNGRDRKSETFIRSAVSDASDFSFAYIDTADVLGDFPNDIAKSAHTDRWLLKPSKYRSDVWTWMNEVQTANRGQPNP